MVLELGPIHQTHCACFVERVLLDALRSLRTIFVLERTGSITAQRD